MKIIIHTYSGEWNSNRYPHPKVPKIGAVVRIHDDPDAREINDFLAVLHAAGLDLDYTGRDFPRLRMSEAKIVRTRE